MLHLHPDSDLAVKAGAGGLVKSAGHDLQRITGLRLAAVKGRDVDVGLSAAVQLLDDAITTDAPGCVCTAGLIRGASKWPLPTTGGTEAWNEGT